MIPSASVNPLIHHPLYNSIHAAIQQTKSITGQKPSLVQINRMDYEKLVYSIHTRTKLGLSIDNVTVISFADVEQGRFYFLP